MRRAGLLLHPSSLPGPYGVGDLGPSARETLAWMDSAGFRIWQVLPLTPVDAAGCPYASPSSFAHEPLLLSVDDLVDDGLLQQSEKPYAPAGPVDWALVRDRKGAALRLAADRCARQVDLDGWAASRPELADWALYRALGREYGHPWNRWPEPVRHREPAALARERDRGAELVRRELALQWLFERQWQRLREDARRRGVELWGDVPIFVSGSSCDVWTHPSLFRLDAAGEPTAVSGVPPDPFAPEGQRWGHPLYDEAAHRAQGFAWWLARFARALDAVDRVRIDHFRGFEAVWEIGRDDADARSGKWIPGPGRPLLDALVARFGAELPLIAEDLGIITPEVQALRDDYGLPGMVILQFAFGGPQADHGHHPYLPHEHRPNQVCYTGTHDNDTAVGWAAGTDERTREHLIRYLGPCRLDGPESDPTQWPAPLLRAAFQSVADSAIVPLQDVLGLGREARMNVPGVAEGNWRFRAGPEAFTLERAARLRRQIALAGRLPAG